MMAQFADACRTRQTSRLSYTGSLEASLTSGHSWASTKTWFGLTFMKRTGGEWTLQDVRPCEGDLVRLARQCLDIRKVERAQRSHSREMRIIHNGDVSCFLSC